MACSIADRLVHELVHKRRSRGSGRVGRPSSCSHVAIAMQRAHHDEGGNGITETVPAAYARLLRALAREECKCFLEKSRLGDFDATTDLGVGLPGVMHCFSRLSFLLTNGGQGA